MSKENITDKEEFIKIVGILSFSDVHPTDCKYITNFIIDLAKENQQLKEMQCTYLGTGCKERRKLLESVLDEIRELINNHNRNAGKLYYRYNNRYLLSEIKEDLLQILDKVKE